MFENLIIFSPFGYTGEPTVISQEFNVPSEILLTGA